MMNTKIIVPGKEFQVVLESCMIAMLRVVTAERLQMMWPWKTDDFGLRLDKQVKLIAELVLEAFNKSVKPEFEVVTDYDMKALEPFYIEYRERKEEVD